jgi:uncharacterized protein YyaL (SSP411 family)
VAPFAREIERRFLPHTTVLVASKETARLAPEIGALTPVEGAAAAYVCENFACRLPVTDPQRLAGILDEPPAAL